MRRLFVVVQLRRTLLLQQFVASQLYDIADEQFTAEKEGPFEHLQFIQKYNLENTVPNIVIMLRIFLTIAVSVATR